MRLVKIGIDIAAVKHVVARRDDIHPCGKQRFRGDGGDAVNITDVLAICDDQICAECGALLG